MRSDLTVDPVERFSIGERLSLRAKVIEISGIHVSLYDGGIMLGQPGEWSEIMQERMGIRPSSASMKADVAPVLVPGRNSDSGHLKDIAGQSGALRRRRYTVGSLSAKSSKLRTTSASKSRHVDATTESETRIVETGP